VLFFFRFAATGTTVRPPFDRKGLEPTRYANPMPIVAVFTEALPRDKATQPIFPHYPLGAKTASQTFVHFCCCNHKRARLVEKKKKK
jgi:hypothetical protein